MAFRRERDLGERASKALAKLIDFAAADNPRDVTGLRRALKEAESFLTDVREPQVLSEWALARIADLERALEQLRRAELESEKLQLRLGTLTAELGQLRGQVDHLLGGRNEALARSAELEEKNQSLRAALQRTRSDIEALRVEVQKLKAPPFPLGTYVGPGGGEMVTINVEGKLYEVSVANPEIQSSALLPGQRVLVNSALNVIDLRQDYPLGEVAKIIEVLDDSRALVSVRDNEEAVAQIGGPLKDKRLKVGDHVRLDPASRVLFEILPKAAVEEVVLEEVPQVRYEDIGGLDEQLEAIKDSVELPYIYGHLFRQYHLKPPKGILLYGPPGCGKTLVAKAVAYNLSLRIKAFLDESREAIELLGQMRADQFDFAAVLKRFEALKFNIYSSQSLYRQRHRGTVDSDKLLEELDQSGILGDFLRRTEGHLEAPRLVCHVQDWLDLLLELQRKGFGGMDKAKIGELLERKKKNYFMRKRKVSDEEYVRRWLSDFLIDRDIDADELEVALKRTNEKLGTGVESYFLNIKGPELLNKYVGETEYRIREVFQRAKEKASFGLPVIVFFDEMESMFRTRGTGRSSDIESTIVPQFLAEIDGVESIENVIVIGASNRQDLIDPAVLRPGRLDVKIRIDRPDRSAAGDIFGKYLKSDLPLDSALLAEHGDDREQCVRVMIEAAVEEMYSISAENEFLRITYQGGDREVLYFKDFASGAMIEAIVSRAKKHAIKRMILTGKRGLRTQDLLDATRGEYKENEDLPNTTNPDDWAKISGKKGEVIVAVEPLMRSKAPERARDIEEVDVDSRYL
jgi:SpoVK/Ycf46/Vps4 family AAA+-type ATPase